MEESQAIHTKRVDSGMTEYGVCNCGHSWIKHNRLYGYDAMECMCKKCDCRNYKWDGIDDGR